MLKTCNQCKIEKDFCRFYKNRPECKECSNRNSLEYRKSEEHKKIKRESNAKYKKTEKGKKSEQRYRMSLAGKLSSQRRRLKYYYNLSVEDYNKLLEKNNFICQICKSDKELCIDHDHKTGNIRGILCRSCNKGLGHFFDNIDILKGAIFYLEKLNA